MYGETPAAGVAAMGAGWSLQSGSVATVVHLVRKG